MRESPRIALSVGEAAGIGVEAAWKALLAHRGEERFLLVGPRPVWERGFLLAGGRGEMPHEVVEPPGTEAFDWAWGEPTAATGRAALRAVEHAAALAGRGEADALVTLPLTKTGLAAAGSPHPGHTELLGALFGTKPLMMFASDDLRVVLATTHLPLRAVPDRIDADGLVEVLSIMARALASDFGLSAARIGVAGLNPHAGESGLLGREEGEVIAPAVARAREAGIDARGPIPADALFPLAHAGRFDAVLAMYHDQGLGPFKLLHFHDGVNVTLNLPIVRTSPDHGTAFDIAGKGEARGDSTAAAIRLASSIARRRAGGGEG